MDKFNNFKKYGMFVLFVFILVLLCISIFMFDKVMHDITMCYIDGDCKGELIEQYVQWHKVDGLSFTK